MEKKHSTILGYLIDDFKKNHSEYRNHKRDYLPYLHRILYINHKEIRVIPDIIHFIWIGEWDQRNEEYINIWRIKNPYKKIFIWVEEDSNIWLNKDNFSIESDANKLTKTVDINHIGLKNYRKHIACILQDDRLFSGSLKDNITGFTNQPDEEWLRECAKIANIHNEIELMPMGYDTLTGELGEGLSGGQRQRIFIARALYSRPGILFMDEATSHLDEDNELLINEAISSLSITRVIIAHRPSTIASANRIIDLTNLSNRR